MKAVILAGGRGTRMKFLKDVPKPMIEINGKPLLARQLEQLKKSGIGDVVILTCHNSKAIEDYLKNEFKNIGMRITVVKEKTPLGTAGAVKNAKDVIQNGNFIVLYGDKALDFDFGKLVDYHYKMGGIATIVAHPTTHMHDSDLLETDGKGKVIAVHKKPHEKGKYFQNLANASIYAFSPRIFRHIPKGKCDFAHNVFPKLCKCNHIYAYRTTEYIKDIGTNERLREAEMDFGKGRTQRKTKAIFLDRDGTLTKKTEVTRIPQLHLVKGAAKTVKKINQSPYLAVLITNQPGVAKGQMSIKDVGEIHKKLETDLSKEGAYLDRIYYCPHHPEKGWKGENKEYKKNCSCRKPGVKLFKKAAKEMGIDLEKSFAVGDMTADILAGKEIGAKTIGAKTGFACRDGKYPLKPDFTVEDVNKAVSLIIYIGGGKK